MLWSLLTLDRTEQLRQLTATLAECQAPSSRDRERQGGKYYINISYSSSRASEGFQFSIPEIFLEKKLPILPICYGDSVLWLRIK